MSDFRKNDIVILKLKTPLTFITDVVQPVKLPSDKNFALNEIENCLVSGWGKLKFRKYSIFKNST